MLMSSGWKFHLAIATAIRMVLYPMEFKIYDAGTSDGSPFAVISRSAQHIVKKRWALC